MKTDFDMMISFSESDKYKILKESGLKNDEEIKSFLKDLDDQGITFEEYVMQGEDEEDETDSELEKIYKLLGRLITENRKLKREIDTNKQLAAFMVAILTESNDLKLPSLQSYLDDITDKEAEFLKFRFSYLFGKNGIFRSKMDERDKKVKLKNENEKAEKSQEG